MTKNVTLRLEEAILKQAKHRAVEADKSLSRWVADLIAREVGRSSGYHEAMQRMLNRMERCFHLGGRPIPRDQLHERR